MPGSEHKSEHTQSRVVFGRNPTVHVPGLRLLTVRVKRSHKNLARIQDLQRDSNLGTFRSEPSIVASRGDLGPLPAIYLIYQFYAIASHLLIS